jgi:hypothetical protein
MEIGKASTIDKGWVVVKTNGYSDEVATNADGNLSFYLMRSSRKN